MRSTTLAPLCTCMAILSGAVLIQHAANAQPVGPTVRDIVEFKRIVQPHDQEDDALPEQVSPDGKRAFIVTRQAEVDRDANRYEILLFDVTPKSLAESNASRPEVVLSVTPEHDNREVPLAVRDVQWHGDHTLVFLARMKAGLFQVYSLDIVTRQLTQLTHETRPILSYAASQDLRRVVYCAQIANPPLKPGQPAVVVGRQSFWAVKFGQDDLRSQDRMYAYFVSDVSSPDPRPLGAAFPPSAAAWPVVSISPDGRWAILPRWELPRLAAWERDYPRVAELSRQYASFTKVDPLAYFSAPLAYTPRRMVAWRLSDGKEQAILDAPDDATPGSAQLRPDRLWQGTGDSVVMAGTHLPLVPGSQESRDSHLIEYWPQTGRWLPIAALRSGAEEAHALPGGFMVMDGTTRREFQREPNGGWREVTTAASEMHDAASAWRLHIEQSLNAPPDLYAIGPGEERRRLTALNPQFKGDTWGTMQPYKWRDAAGRQWGGGLLVGAGMRPDTRYPLLIQTYGFSPDRFYLDAPNAYDGYTSGFAGRAFLREGILVLQMPLMSTVTGTTTDREIQKAFDESVRAAIDSLVKEGRVNPSKVGMMGWSATGQHVLDFVTFSDVPIRAATLADGDANTIFSTALIFGKADSMLQGKKESNDGLPFGDTLSAWVRNDPSLHTDCIHAAMRIETYGPWVLNNWDIYGLLRLQYKAAEMVVIPDAEHALSIPSHRMVSLQGNVDWYGFWLAGKIRIAPLLASETAGSVAAQYANWRQMETLKAADDARPRCVR